MDKKDVRIARLEMALEAILLLGTTEAPIKYFVALRIAEEALRNGKQDEEHP